jgi:hypothetical protein
MVLTYLHSRTSLLGSKAEEKANASYRSAINRQVIPCRHCSSLETSLTLIAAKASREITFVYHPAIQSGLSLFLLKAKRNRIQLLYCKGSSLERLIFFASQNTTIPTHRLPGLYVTTQIGVADHPESLSLDRPYIP